MIIAGRYSISGYLSWHKKGENMEITAIAIENLRDKGLELLEETQELSTNEEVSTVCPDTFGICIGYCDKKTDTYKSLFKKDEENGNTYYLEQYLQKCTMLHEQYNTVLDMDTNELITRVYYYVLYDVQESSKNRPTEVENHVENAICANGYFMCEYELLFAQEGYTRRCVISYASNNIPMYQFIGNLEEEVAEILSGDYDDDNLFKDIISVKEDSTENYGEIFMLDKVGGLHTIEFMNASELMSMLVSVRLLNCKFVEK